jgi:excinuclease ABC subunit C
MNLDPMFENSVIISSKNKSLSPKFFLKEFPYSCGCYIFKDKDNKVLYIGKAKNLRKRVSQYFNIGNLPIKTQKLLSLSKFISYIQTDNEAEALILESNLIKKHKPRYNILLKDDKQYAWVKITNDEFPKIERVREKKNDGATYFGPYPNAYTTIKVLSNLRKIFPYRTCNLKIHEGDEVIKPRVCIYYHIGLCTGPCDNLQTREDYMKNINNIKKFFKSKKHQIIKDYEKEMVKASKEERFEDAINLRDKIEDIRYVTQNIRVDFGDPDDPENRTYKNRKKENIEALKKLFLRLHIKYNNGRVECYDISNIQGKYPVSSMVVFKDGEMSKSNYRKFKIKADDMPNDPLMMYETLTRRLSNKSQDKSFSEIPDLIVVDGGKTQVSAGSEALKKLGLNIPLIGLAKRYEEIYLPNIKEPIRLRQTDQSLLVLRQIRDEAHRFAITFHRQIRSKGMYS